MNNKSDKKVFDLKKQFKIAIKTFLVLALFSYLFLLFDTVVNYDVDTVSKKEVDQHLILYEIEQLKTNPKYWDNSRICYEIGSLYEMIYLFDVASKYYQRSIELATRNYYAPHLKLARLNLDRNKFEDAEFVINLIPNINNKRIKYNKGLFYEDLSVKYVNKKRIDDAISAIKKAVIYFETADEEKYINAKNEHAYLMMIKSEELVAQNKVKEAMEILNSAIKENDSAELKYRLAVLNYGFNNEKALKLFEETLELNPTIINYNLYYQLLDNLIKKAEQNKKLVEVNLYKQKQNALQKFINANFIYDGDFKLENIQAFVESKKWGIQKFIHLTFDIQSNSKDMVKTLYAELDFNVNGKDFSKIIKIGNANGIIMPYALIKNNEAVINISEVHETKYKIDGKIYLYKNPKFNKIEIGKFSL